MKKLILSLVLSLFFASFLTAQNVAKAKSVEQVSKKVKTEVKTTAELGIDPDYLEAICFAWLAKQRIDKKSFNLNRITGSKGKVYLGRIYNPS